MKFLLALFLLISLDTVAQNSLSNIRTILTEADSVIIASHESLVVPEKRIGGPPEKSKEIIINGKPNFSIILKSHKLDHKSIDSLVFILTKEVSGDITQMACYDPHHAIYIFKKKTVSYLDICFGCQRFSKSKDIKFDIHELTNETWIELESFFAKRIVDNTNPF
jgi:hypothetical protein